MRTAFEFVILYYINLSYKNECCYYAKKHNKNHTDVFMNNIIFYLVKFEPLGRPKLVASAHLLLLDSPTASVSIGYHKISPVYVVGSINKLSMLI